MTKHRLVTPISHILGGAWIALFVLANSLCAAPGDEHWDTQFGWPGSLDNISAIRLHDGKLYYGGSPSSGTNATLSVFDGTQVTRLGLFGGSSGVTIYDLMFVGGTLYVGGSFTSVDGVEVRGLARWNGSAWSATGMTNGAVLALETDGVNLYAGGLFTNPGGVLLTNVGRWNGSSWQALGSGLGGTNRVTSDVVRALLLTNGVLYAAGNFSNAGTQALSHIAMWNGTTWSSVGGGISGTTVFGMAWNGGSLYAVGGFSQAGATPVSNVARWDGTTWSALGSGVSGTSGFNGGFSVASFNNLICVAGNFTSAGGNPATNFAVWDGSNWSPAGADLGATASRVYSSGTEIYVGGNFLRAAGGIMAGLTAWDGTSWRAIGPPGKIAGLAGTVRAVTTDGSNIFAGGLFALAGRTNATRVGRYDGSQWHPVGGGLNNTVRHLALVGTNLYAAGDFTGGVGGGSLALGMARWDGSFWQPLNNTAFNNISCLAVRGADLFVGGFGGINAANGRADDVARWDGTNFWKFLAFDHNTFNLWPLGGTNITSIGIDGTNIYLAGNFQLTQCDDNFPPNCIESANVLRFDGTFARLMGGGLSGPASAIAVVGTNVYFAGAFTNAGGITVNRIARWDGQSWSQVGGTGIGGTGVINAMAVIGTNLYVGGTFTNINGVRALRLARWDGTTWTPLGSGVAFSGSSGPVFTLRAVGQDLYVGGTFQLAGGKPSYYLARWNEGADFDIERAIRLSKSRKGIGPFTMTVTASGVPGYVIEATTNFATWTPLLTNTTSPYEFLDMTAPAYPHRFYRARQSP